ncbi:MAG: hypothetical protein V1837_06025 [Candidatus Woesearchaeota archaeon]
MIGERIPTSKKMRCSRKDVKLLVTILRNASFNYESTYDTTEFRFPILGGHYVSAPPSHIGYREFEYLKRTISNSKDPVWMLMDLNRDKANLYASQVPIAAFAFHNHPVSLAFVKGVQEGIVQGIADVMTRRRCVPANYNVTKADIIEAMLSGAIFGDKGLDYIIQVKADVQSAKWAAKPKPFIDLVVDLFASGYRQGAPKTTEIQMDTRFSAFANRLF